MLSSLKIAVAKTFSATINSPTILPAATLSQLRVFVYENEVQYSCMSKQKQNK